MNLQFMQEALRGCYLVNLGFACDLLWLHFSKDAVAESAEYALHVQTWSRALADGRVQAVSNEMYPDVWRDDWDFNASKYAQDLRRFLDERREVPLERVECAACGDLRLCFGDGSEIQVIVNCTDEADEMWRFLAGEDQPHLVRDCSGLVCQ